MLNRRFVALLASGATLAMAALVGASTSTQVKQLDPLVVPRTAHAATALTDGRILITGGRDSAGNIVAVSEIFDPATETSTAGATLTTPRVDHTATLLPDGRVLVAGGTGTSGSLMSAEIFDPSNAAAGFRVLSATMGAARARHTATLLNNGTVLIAGGDDAGTAEIFDPATESFSSALLAMAAPRIGHSATLFSDDSVLLAGGNTDSMELFTATDQKFTLDSQVMSAAHTGQEAISLSDTRLLFFGGDAANTIEEFNSTADTITIKTNMDAPASSATLLANGKILVLRSDMAGLYAPDAPDASTALTAFDETSVPGSNILLRSGQTATQLSGDKKILVAGGVNAQNLFINPAVFNPARIWTDKDDYLPEDPVLLYGSGWKASEAVYLYAVDSGTEQWTYGSTVNADANGGFAIEPLFIVQMRQLGLKFSVSAVGAQSAMQADVTFTDAGNFTYASNPSPASFTNPPGNIAPFTESVTAPKNNGTFSATVVMTGTGATPIPAGWMTLNTGAQSFVTGGPGGTDVTKNWTVTITVPPLTPDGTYTGNIKASVTSTPPPSGPNPGSGTDVTITIDKTPPAPPSTPDLINGDDTGISNIDNITNKTTSLGFNGTAEKNSTVELFDEGTSLGTTTASSGGAWNKSVNLTPGDHSITAKAKDAAGNTSDPSGALAVTVDTTKPTVTINQAAGQADPATTGPINFTVEFSESVDSTFVSADVAITGTAGATSGIVTGGPITFNVAVPTPPNGGTVIASIAAGVATDIAGNTNFASTSGDNTVTYNPCTAASVTTQPSDVLTTYGDGNVQFIAQASGTPTPTVQWQVNTGSGFNDIVGATSDTLTIIHPTVAMSGNQYKAVFTNTCGGTQTATSNAATLTVNKANATVVVTPYHVTYDCNSHTATVGSIIGAYGETGATVGAVDLSGTTHTDANTYNDTWTFTGTANYNNIGATPVTDIIDKADTTTSVTSDANPSIIGQNVTFTATVMANPSVACTPTGTVTFKDGATTLAAGVALSGGSATFSTASLSAGNHSITAVYSGDGNFNATGATPGSTASIYVQMVHYVFVGFLQPIDNLPYLNSSKAGQTVPVKWQLKDYAGNLINDLSTLAPNGLTSVRINCDSSEPIDAIEELAAPGSTVFRFDGTQFIYNWQTSKSWAGTCRLMTVTLTDGTKHSAQFTFK
jgi:large repetitive protein